MKNDIDSNRFVLQDTRTSVGNSAMWWAKGNAGYTSDIARAEVMTRYQAQRQHDCRETDLPWPLAVLAGQGRQGVDMQHVGEPVDLAGYPDDTPCYLQVQSDYHGNDIIWVYEDKGHRGADIDRASILPAHQALREIAWQGHLVAWPVEIINARIQRRIPLSVLTDKAWEGCGIRRHRPAAPPAASRHQCHGCGRFMKERDFFTAPCRHCDMDNRP